MCTLHHIAISVENIEQYRNLFEKLGMNVNRITGVSPCQQIWFDEGIQLKEVSSLIIEGTNIDHIALHSGNVNELIQTALENGCIQDFDKDNWFTLPNGISVEVMS